MAVFPKHTFRRTDIWREGTWIDLWSVVHVLSGTLVGFGFYFLHFTIVVSCVLALCSFVAYEIWESIEKIEELLTNRFTDIVFGMTGYLLITFVLAPRLSRVSVIGAFAFLFIVDVVMSTFGWRASQKAAVLEKRLRTKYAKQGAWLSHHSGRLRARYIHYKRPSK